MIRAISREIKFIDSYLIQKSTPAYFFFRSRGDLVLSRFPFNSFIYITPPRNVNWLAFKSEVALMYSFWPRGNLIPSREPPFQIPSLSYNIKMKARCSLAIIALIKKQKKKDKKSQNMQRNWNSRPIAKLSRLFLFHFFFFWMHTSWFSQA